MHQNDGRERTGALGDVGVQSEADVPGLGEIDIGFEAGDCRPSQEEGEHAKRTPHFYARLATKLAPRLPPSRDLMPRIVSPSSVPLQRILASPFLPLRTVTKEKLAPSSFPFSMVIARLPELTEPVICLPSLARLSVAGATAFALFLA